MSQAKHDFPIHSHSNNITDLCIYIQTKSTSSYRELQNVYVYVCKTAMYYTICTNVQNYVRLPLEVHGRYP